MLDNNVLFCVYSGLLLSQGSQYMCFTQEQNLICLFLGETKMGRYGAWAKACCKVILEGCFPCKAASRQPSCLLSVASRLVLRVTRRAGPAGAWPAACAEQLVFYQGWILVVEDLRLNSPSMYWRHAPPTATEFCFCQ